MIWTSGASNIQNLIKTCSWNPCWHMAGDTGHAVHHDYLTEEKVTEHSINHIFSRSSWSVFFVSVWVMNPQMHWTSAHLFLLYSEILCHPQNHSLVCVGCSWVDSLSRGARIRQKAMLHFYMSIGTLSPVTHLATSNALINAWTLWV